ncbi:MAG: hypothetical protein Q9227_004566 [Pyrenula ochraceoflavens]
MYLRTLTVISCISLGAAQALNTNLTLPWGTWQAQPLDTNPKIYLFKNVRFGGTPTRFGSPSFPAPIPDNSTIQDSSYGPSCFQVDPRNIKNPPGGRPGSEIGNPIGAPEPPANESEDCLFLDIYVPAPALEKPNANLPVIVWLYGGAYAFGSKVQFGRQWPFYSGQGIIEASNQNLIFVAGNYRLGAFGWLAGSYMEKAGLPNAGFYDQRLLLEWVQKYIGKVGGNPQAVSAWGESAGAGSIMHHLIQAKGTRDPLFSKAMLQSPAFQWQWDRHGTLNAVYQNFSKFAGCGDKFDIGCLRSADINKLVDANQMLFETVNTTGLFPLGPSVDGIWMDTLPAVQFASGDYWKSLQSILVSHVANESATFTPKYVVSAATFNQFLHAFMPEASLAPIRSAILSQYNCTSPPYNGDYRACASTLIRDSTFTCNTRQLFDAYAGKAYMMQYSFPAPTQPPAQHAQDLVPLFLHDNMNVTALLLFLNSAFTLPEAQQAAFFVQALSRNYKNYLASYAAYGDPNTKKGFDAIKWPLASATGSGGDQVGNVMEARLKPGFSSAHWYFDVNSDGINTKSSCLFWNKIAAMIEGVQRESEAEAEAEAAGMGRGGMYWQGKEVDFVGQEKVDL